MSSVIVHWQGRCMSRKKQLELCKFITRLAEVSHSFYEKPPEIRHFDNYIEGKILLPHLLLPRFHSSSPSSKIKPVKEKRKILFDQILLGKETTEVKYFLLEKVHLYGMEFHLYDPRELYEDRVSFVFLSHKEVPALNGKIVMVEDHNECQWYESKIIKQSDWYLTTPSIHLRYYLERWFDYFLGWIKYFFVPNLNFWRYECLPGYKELKQKLDQELRVKSKDHLKEEIFNDILEKFRSEAMN